MSKRSKRLRLSHYAAMKAAGSVRKSSRRVGAFTDHQLAAFDERCRLHSHKRQRRACIVAL
jgi:hypothetical protein